MNSLKQTIVIGFIVLLVLLLALAGCGEGGQVAERYDSVAATTPAEAVATEPVAAEVVLAEGETVCEMSIDDSMPGLTRDEPVYGEVTRGELQTGRMHCPGMLDNARLFSLVTLIDEDGVPGALNFMTEYVPEAGGAWLGNGHFDDPDGVMTMYVTLDGEGELEGQRMEFVLKADTMTATYRIVQVPQE